MKKLVAIAAIAVLGALSAFGQGQIVFGNTSAGSAFKIKVTDPIGLPGVTQTVGTASTLLGTGSVRITLLVGNTGDPISSMVPVASLPAGTLTVSNALTTTALSQGTFSGGTPTFAIGWDTVGKPTIQFAYVGWDIASGITSWTSLFAGDTYLGADNSVATFAAFSGIITGYAPGFSTATAPQTFGTGAFQIPTVLFIKEVPEPSTFVLAGLGAAALMIFRRRK